MSARVTRRLYQPTADLPTVVPPLYAGGEEVKPAQIRLALVPLRLGDRDREHELVLTEAEAARLRDHLTRALAAVGEEKARRA